MSLTKSTFHGLKWTSFATAVKAGANIGFAAIMARLLGPAVFGLVAMANTTLRFGFYFARMGVNSAIVQKPQLCKEEIRAAFTISTAFGLLAASVFYFGAPITVVLFKEPAISPIIKVLSLNFIFSAITMTSEGILKRNMRFKAISQVEIFSYIFGYGAVGVICAINNMGVWALVAASISQNFINALAFFIIARPGVLPVFRWKHYHSLLSFGSRISLISFLEFLSSSADTFFIGRYLGSITLGFYNRAKTLVELPLYHFSSSISRVLFPAFSRKYSTGSGFSDAFLSVNRIMFLMLIPLCFGICIGAKELVLVILGPDWVQVVVPVRVLSIALLLNYETHIFGVAFESAAKLNTKIILQTAYLAIVTTLFFVLIPYGLNAVLFGFLIANLLRFIVYVLLADKYLGIRLVPVLQALAQPMFISMIIILGSGGFICFADSLSVSPVISLVVQIVWGLVILVLLTFKGPFKSLKKEIKSRVLLVTNNNLVNKVLANLADS